MFEMKIISFQKSKQCFIWQIQTAEIACRLGICVEIFEVVKFIPFHIIENISHQRIKCYHFSLIKLLQ